MYWNIVDKMGYAPDRRLKIDKWVKYRYRWIWKVQSKIVIKSRKLQSMRRDFTGDIYPLKLRKKGLFDTVVI